MGVLSGSGLLNALNVRVVGSGRRILVLSHGFGTDQSAWQRILPYFHRDFKIVLFDLICAGSVNPDYYDFDRYSCMDAYAEDLITILDELNVESCVFVGHSISAMIGCKASIKRPSLFTKLVLFGASPSYMNDNEYQGGFERKDIDKVFDAMKSNYKDWVKGFAPLLVGADVPAAVREFSRTLFNMRPDIALHVCEIVFNNDMRDILKHVKVPCCVVQTSKDMAVPLSVATYVQRNLGGRSSLEILDTEGHLPHLSQPAKIIQLLRRILYQ
ncbi:hypothetical protein SUGI_0579010 [Cryptomeria japonica]|uniref:probable strigolactone esterase DAD2 n=1 Tax=Cryptomeria japonica TaxID=3369 RepID=UPI0024147236|nr:probable strigolactone esterase DAD2 [Cryptomeria japonica]GLJ29360.1 hypothetical protein SUGI_0579010 [Cryptomeria japonica]